MWLSVIGAVIAVLFLVGFVAHLRDEARQERAEHERDVRDWLEGRGL